VHHEQFLHSDPPAPEELSNAIAWVRDLVADVPRVIPAVRDAATLVGLAGTVTTVAAVELGLPEYDAEKIHGFRLSRAAVEDFVPSPPRRPPSARPIPASSPGAST
jgi:exopolyphosphatase/guanosine-5'-triphosphate,3'-diphosphate pyrophosphatase